MNITTRLSFETRPIFGRTLVMSMITAVVAVVLFVFAPLTHANTPTLTLTPSGNSDGVQINVTGDANQTVILSYTKTGVGLSVSSIGSTDANGNFSVIISSAAYGITANTSVYVSTGGLSGPQSASVAWPDVTGSTNSNLSLNQNGIVLTVGQSSSVTATNNTSGSLYLANNSNPPIASVNISGNQVNIIANAVGSTVATLCTVGNTTNCPNLSITVLTSGASLLSFSQTNVAVSSGQSVPITIYGGSGIYVIENNPNPTSVQATLSSNTITVTTTGTTGVSSITVCSTDLTACGILTVTVGTVSSSAISFSQSNPVLSSGQSTSISISGGGSGSVYTMSSNSNPSVAQAAISGDSLVIIGDNNGSSTITVCASTGGCGSVSVTVQYTAAGGTLTLSQSSLVLLTGQSLPITISGGTSPYSFINPSSSIAQASLNGNILTVTGETLGSSSISVCSSEGACTTLLVQINGTGSVTTAPATAYPPVIFSQASIAVAAGQNQSISLSGGLGGGYYLAYNSNSAAVSVSVSGTILSINGLADGAALVVVCTSASTCGAVPVTVVTGAVPTPTPTPTTTSGWVYCAAENGQCAFSGEHQVQYGANGQYFYGNYADGVLCSNATFGDPDPGFVKQCSYNSAVTTDAITPTPVPTPAPTPTSSASTYQFLNPIVEGDSGPDVTALQQRLTTEGVYSGPITGYFGALTLAAVEQYQGLHGLDQLGNVGPGTRAALNAGE